MSSLFEQFVAFVNAQPDDRPLNHNNGWDDCVVGHFADVVGCSRPWRMALDLGVSAQEHVGTIDGYTFKNMLGSPSTLMHQYGVYGDTYESVKRLIKMFQATEGVDIFTQT